jgi:hypothetical protein
MALVVFNPIQPASDFSSDTNSDQLHSVLSSEASRKVMRQRLAVAHPELRMNHGSDIHGQDEEEDHVKCASICCYAGLAK